MQFFFWIIFGRSEIFTIGIEDKLFTPEEFIKETDYWKGNYLDTLIELLAKSRPFVTFNMIVDDSKEDMAKSSMKDDEITIPRIDNYNIISYN